MAAQYAIVIFMLCVSLSYSQDSPNKRSNCMDVEGHCPTTAQDPICTADPSMAVMCPNVCQLGCGAPEQSRKRSMALTEMMVDYDIKEARKRTGSDCVDVYDTCSWIMGSQAMCASSQKTRDACCHTCDVTMRQNQNEVRRDVLLEVLKKLLEE